MADGTETIEEFLDEKPSVEEKLGEVLAVDRHQDTWTFDDIPLNAGEFGEVVSRGIVEKHDGEYRVADPDAVERVLTGEPASSLHVDLGVDRVLSRGRWRPSIDIRTTVGLVVTLGFLLAMRILNYPNVFREERVISPANDPYFYRYWTDQLLEISANPWSLEVFANLPGGAARRRPFTHAANWWITAILGGDQWAADMTAAWLPVVATLVLGIVLYWTAVTLTRDVRVGLASIFLLALVPVHAVYSGLGFLEHRLHQYLWLGVTIMAMTWLAVDLRRRSEEHQSRDVVVGHLLSPWSWVAAGGIGVGLAITMHAWGGSILMCVPVAVYLGLKVVLDVREGISPALANVPVVVGVGIGTAISAHWHFRCGWHEAFVVYVPLMVIAGAIGVIALGELWRWGGWHLGGLLAIQPVLAGTGVWLFRREYPAVYGRLRDRSEDLFFREGATETGSLFGADMGGTLFGPIAQIGLDFFIALAMLAWASLVVWRRYDPGWLVLIVYTGVWLVFAGIQVRFAAQLSVPLSILGGFGLVWLLAWMDLIRPPRPFREDDDGRPMRESQESEPAIALPQERAVIGYLALALLLVCGFSLMFVPVLATDVIYGEDETAAITAIEEHVETVDRETQFVLSEWGANRMYNYFVHGDAASYGYAQSNYGSFVEADDPDGWFDMFDGRVGYVVVSESGGTTADESVQAQLHENVALEKGGVPDLAHYRLLQASDDVTTYAVVPGATIYVNGSTEFDTAKTTVEIDGETASYERSFEPVDNRSVATTVAYPGEYEIGEEVITVTEADVVNGSTIEVDRSGGE